MKQDSRNSRPQFDIHRLTASGEWPLFVQEFADCLTHTDSAGVLGEKLVTLRTRDTGSKGGGTEVTNALTGRFRFRSCVVPFG